MNVKSILKDRFNVTEIIAMAGFALVFSMAPGPVNLVTLSSGINYGVKGTIAFVAGATAGFTLLLLLLGLGLAEVIISYPNILTVIKGVGTAFLLYLAYKLATAKGEMAINEASRPSFLEGVLMQWLNPKAWLACLTGLAAFTKADDVNSLIFFATIYFVICFFGVGIWSLIGNQLKMLLHNQKHLRLVNIMMGALLSGLALFVLFS